MAWTNSLPTEVMFTRSESVAGAIEQLIRTTEVSLNAALYRFNSQRLCWALDDAQKKGVRVRLWSLRPACSGASADG